MQSAQPVKQLVIPLENLERVFASAAVPGFHGQVRVEFCIQPEAAEQLLLNVTRIGVEKSTSSSPEQMPATGKTERARMVDDAVKKLSSRLRLTFRAGAVIGHFQDGRLLKYEVEDEVVI